MKGLAGMIVVVVAVNIGAVAGRLTGSGTRNVPLTTDVIFSLALLTLPSGYISRLWLKEHL